MSCYQKKTYQSLSSPSHALAPEAELSCSVPIVTDVPHKGNAYMKTLTAMSITVLALFTPPEAAQQVSSTGQGHVAVFSQVRPVTHGRTSLPQSGRQGVTERSRLTALPDLRE